VPGGPVYYGKHGGSSNAWLGAAYVDLFGPHADVAVFDAWRSVLE
jgi:hypothetical protein